MKYELRHSESSSVTVAKCLKDGEQYVRAEASKRVFETEVFILLGYIRSHPNIFPQFVPDLSNAVRMPRLLARPE